MIEFQKSKPGNERKDGRLEESEFRQLHTLKKRWKGKKKPMIVNKNHIP